MSSLLAGRRVLVVEDEMMVLMVMEDMLRELGCESVAAASTPEQALSLVATHGFDMAMLDVNLNGRTSYPVADALAAIGVPFAFATGYGTHGAGPAHRDRPILTKPFGELDLVKVVERLLPL